MESTLTSPVSSAVPAHLTASRSVPAAPVARAQLWTGRSLSGFAVLFLTFDVAMKLFHTSAAVQGSTELGYSESSVGTIGVIELICLVVYLIPRTAVLGAVLFTGYLGGAIATHVRLDNPLFTHVLFPIYIAAFIWGGIYLRDRALHAVLPFRKVV
jgi:hypothetical protein